MFSSTKGKNGTGHANDGSTQERKGRKAYTFGTIQYIPNTKVCATDVGEFRNVHGRIYSYKNKENKTVNKAVYIAGDEEDENDDIFAMWGLARVVIVNHGTKDALTNKVLFKKYICQHTVLKGEDFYNRHEAELDKWKHVGVTAVQAWIDDNREKIDELLAQRIASLQLFGVTFHGPETALYTGATKVASPGK